MTDFFVTAPDATAVVGGPGEDRLFFTLASGPGGTTMTDLTGDLLGGYGGVFNVDGPDDTSFTGIEHFTFTDDVGGKDVITTGAGSDTLKGGKGNDVLNGSGGMDTLFGNSGRDRLYGGNGSDQLEGGLGNDTLFGGSGNDSLMGGDGDDRIFGGAGDDFIVTGDGNDVVDAGRGSDFIIAGIGDTQILGGRGDDFIEISFDGVKTIDGGTEHDAVFAFFNDLEQGDIELLYNMNTGVHRAVGSSVNKSTIINVEDYAMIGKIDATLVGNGANNELFSDQGDDTLKGKVGKDSLSGGGGDDTLFGGRGHDTLDGGAGNDILDGGSGNDTIVFSAGLDVFQDFKDDVDTIHLHTSLVAPGETVQDVIDNYATVVNGNVLLTFDAGNVLTINGLTNASALIDDMILV